jgi:hypothetical protein
MATAKIWFDDHQCTERLYDPYHHIDESYPLGLALVDFLSLSGNFKNSNHIYLRLDDYADESITDNSWLFTQMKQYIHVCMEDPAAYSIDTFMFVVHLMGSSIPENYLDYDFDSLEPDDEVVKPRDGQSSYEETIKAFTHSDKTKHVITTVYMCDGIADVCLATLDHLIKVGYAIKKCSNCGKYFIPLHRSDALYCDRISPFNSAKTCKEDGSQRTFEAKLKLNEAEKLRRNIYQIKQMRVRRNPDILFYKDDFEKWKIAVSDWKAAVKRGDQSMLDFIQWLNESK